LNRHAASFYFLLILVATATIWWFTRETGKDATTPRTAGHFPSSYAEHLTVTEYNTDGIPNYKLQTPRMRSYEDTDTSELDRPDIWHYIPGSAPWRLRGEMALVEQEGERIFLPGKVIIDRAARGKSPPYHIVTRDLHLVTETSYAETDQAIRIESRDDWITAVGMHAWLKDPLKINLLNQVHGYYESL
jgi:LPS export ABC transporter protein LptC